LGLQRLGDSSFWRNSHYEIKEIIWDLGGPGWNHHAAIRIHFSATNTDAFFDNGSERAGDRGIWGTWERGSLFLTDPGYPIIAERPIEDPFTEQDW